MSAVATVQACRVAEIFDDAGSAALFAEYEAECANPLLPRTAPQRAMYEQQEQYGVAQCYAGRVDGVLCAVAFVVLSPFMHYGGRFAIVESLFVAREHRPGGLGSRLMQVLEEDAKQLGCTEVFYTAPVKSALAQLLFLWSDRYVNTNHIFCRSLK